jgi:hypothetical protein
VAKAARWLFMSGGISLVLLLGLAALGLAGAALQSR